jgi:hypothetical protein
MPGRSWFVAAGDKQEGPYSEDEFRDLIVRGNVRPDTYVWADGMQDWQYAGDIPGLLSGSVAPPAMPRPGVSVPSANGDPSSGSFSIDFPLLEFVWRSLVFVIGSTFIIPVPWLLVWYLKWLVPCVQVPGRPNLSFEGTAMAIIPWYFGFFVVAIAISLLGSDLLSNLVIVVQLVLYWLFTKWLVANLASGGQPLGLSFSGTVWAFLGWNLLAILSVLTIIGWAWVYAAGTRWFCRNIQGTRRAVIFNGSGLEILWRGIVTVIGCAFIIPIPWVVRWYWQWVASQFAVVPRAATPERVIEASRV